MTDDIPTPHTDAAICEMEDERTGLLLAYIRVGFSRQLERENHVMREALEFSAREFLGEVESQAIARVDAMRRAFEEGTK